MAARTKQNPKSITAQPQVLYNARDGRMAGQVFGGFNDPENMSDEQGAALARRSNRDAEIISTADQERMVWQEGLAYVTERIGFAMRDVWKRSRKNYYGIYDVPIDSITKLRKIFYPITEYTVEATVKNVNIDTKDIMIHPKGSDDLGVARICRYCLNWLFGKLNFNQTLHDFIRNMCLDGTAVMKVWKVDQPNGKPMVKCANIDLLNFFIDPVADSIQTAAAVLERSIMTIDEFRSYSNVWENVDIVMGSQVKYKTIDSSPTDRSIVPYVTVWERWGKIRKSWLAEFENDKEARDIWIDGHIVMSNLAIGAGDVPRVHLVEENKDIDNDTGLAIKPYEEAWFTRVPGRWAGRGQGEKLFDIQVNLNEIINIRANNSRLLQNGLFQVRQGSGLRNDVLSRLTAGGVIPVTAIDQDIKQLQTVDYRNSSYADQHEMELIGEKNTSSPLISQGQPTPSSMPATNANIQNQNAKSSFQLIQEEVGLFLRRLVQKHMIPLLNEVLDKDTVVRITADVEDIQEIDDRLLDYKVKKGIIAHYNKYGIVPSDEEIAQAEQDAREQMHKSGNHRFVSGLGKNFFNTEFDVEADVMDDTFDRGVVIQQLREMLTSYSQMPNSNLNTDRIMQEILDILGMDYTRYFNKVQPVQPNPPPANMAPGRLPAGSTPVPANMPQPQAAQQAQAVQGVQQ